MEYGQCVYVCVGGGGPEVGITRHQQSIKGDYRNLTAMPINWRRSWG